MGDKIDEDDIQRFVKVMNEVGIPFVEAEKAAEKLAETITKCAEVENEIRLIQSNPCLTWWEKRKIIKELKKEFIRRNGK